MRVTFAAVALAAVATAKPQQLPGLAVMTPEQAGEYCGTGLTLRKLPTAEAMKGFFMKR